MIDYDGNGNTLSESSVEGAESFANTFIYDSLNRLIKRADNAGHAFTYEYDTRNNLTATTDPKDTPGLDNGATTGEGNKVRYIYDGVNRLIEEVKELTATDTISIRYAYDDNGRLAEITDANSHSTRFVYDALNRQTEVKLHNNAVYNKRYDRNSNLIEEMQPNGFKSASVYDALNRLVQKTITLKNAPAGSEAFKYDLLSRMVEAKNTDPFDNTISTVGFEYDSLSRVTKEILNGRSISKEYDGIGNVTKRTYPSGRVVDNSYDTLNRLTAIKQTPVADGIIEQIFGADTVDILNTAYTGKDRPKNFTFGNNTKTEFAYDSVKRLTSVIASPQGVATPIVGFIYGYDKADNRLSEVSLRGEAEAISRSFTYDSLSRLTQSTDPTVTQQWTLDKVDNWLKKATVIANPEGEAISRETIFTPNTVNSYTKVDNASYVYDENGNLLDDGVYTYTYNYRNLLTRVVNKANATEVASYSYDALGRRISKTVSGQMTRYVYEGVQIISEIAPNDTISKEFIYGDAIDNPIALVIPAEAGIQSVYYYHKDGLGSTVALTDKSGAIVERYKYGPYGEPEITDANGVLLEESAIGNNHLYTGQIYDAETGFYYYKARYYHPTLGRFLQRDPLGYVDGYNLYSYTNNNPINWIDPLGMKAGDIYLFAPDPKSPISQLIPYFTPDYPRFNYSHSLTELAPDFIGNPRYLDFNNGIRGRPDIITRETFLDRYKERRLDVFEPVRAYTPEQVIRLEEFAQKSVNEYIYYPRNIEGNNYKEAVCSMLCRDAYEYSTDLDFDEQDFRAQPFGVDTNIDVAPNSFATSNDFRKVRDQDLKNNISNGKKEK